MDTQINKQVTVAMQHSSEEDIFYLGIKTIIKNNNKILLLKVEKGVKNYWDLPGGRVQINENSETTARREVAEETGITNIHNISHVGMFMSKIRIPTKDGRTVGLIFSIYKGDVEDTIVTLSSEHQHYEWVTLQKATELLDSIYGKALDTL